MTAPSLPVGVDRDPFDAPLWVRGTPFNLGAVLWFAQALCWRLPVLWRLGNAISDFRFTLFMKHGWEWV